MRLNDDGKMAFQAIRNRASRHLILQKGSYPINCLLNFLFFHHQMKLQIQKIINIYSNQIGRYQSVFMKLSENLMGKSSEILGLINILAACLLLSWLPKETISLDMPRFTIHHSSDQQNFHRLPQPRQNTNVVIGSSADRVCIWE